MRSCSSDRHALLLFGSSVRDGLGVTAPAWSTVESPSLDYAEPSISFIAVKRASPFSLTSGEAPSPFISREREWQVEVT